MYIPPIAAFRDGKKMGSQHLIHRNAGIKQGHSNSPDLTNWDWDPLKSGLYQSLLLIFRE